ncbi:MAG: hypothetical protein ABIJ48_04245 [Actinomycetota bacterium]
MGRLRRRPRQRRHVTFPVQTTGADGTYLFAGMPPVVAVAAGSASADEDLVATTATSCTYTPDPGQDCLNGDIGLRAQEDLPGTGLGADRLGPLALGLILVLTGRRGDGYARLRRERLR